MSTTGPREPPPLGNRTPPAIPREDAERDPLVGRVLDMRYRVGPRIAVGAMGKIYFAVQEPLNRVVAVKILSPAYAGELDPEFERRFYLEASAAASLHHPHTVTVHDFGVSEEGLFYIVMEMVEGRTLAQLVRDQGALDPLRAVRIIAKVARSLREAHQKGVVHRDLKPENIMLTEFECEPDWVKVVDFGLVKLYRRSVAEVSADAGEEDELTDPNLVMGSPRFMSPEQARNRGVEPRSDVYSLGIVLFLLLTGKVPFGQQKKTPPVDIINGHLNERPPLITDVAPDRRLTPDLVQIVDRCLAKRPADRFADMDHLLDTLWEAEQRLIRKGAGGSARALSAGGGGRFIGALLTLATLVLLGAAGLVGYVVLGERLSADTPSNAPGTPARPPRPVAAAPSPPPIQSPAPTPEATPSPPRAVAPPPAAEPAGDPVLRPAPLPEPSPRAAPALSAKPASPVEITFILTSSPDGAAVFEGGELLGHTPLTLNRVSARRDQPPFLDVSLRLPGHAPRRVRTTSRDAETDPVMLHAELRRVSPTPAETRGAEPPSPEEPAPGGAPANEPPPEAPAPAETPASGSPPGSPEPATPPADEAPADAPPGASEAPETTRPSPG